MGMSFHLKVVDENGIEVFMMGTSSLSAMREQLNEVEKVDQNGSRLNSNSVISLRIMRSHMSETPGEMPKTRPIDVTFDRSEIDELTEDYIMKISNDGDAINRLVR